MCVKFHIIVFITKHQPTDDDDKPTPDRAQPETVTVTAKPKPPGASNPVEHTNGTLVERSFAPIASKGLFPPVSPFAFSGGNVHTIGNRHHCLATVERFQSRIRVTTGMNAVVKIQKPLVLAIGVKTVFSAPGDTVIT